VFVGREELLFETIGRCYIESFLVESVYVFIVFVGYGKKEFVSYAILLKVVG
jgi:hypothetical protein